MRSLYRSLLGVALILLVALTSVHLGMARGQARMAGSIVLCTGTGPVAVAVDRDGQPIERPHVCPDCVFTAMAGLAAPLSLTEWQVQPRKMHVAEVARVAVSARQVTPQARGPPRIL
jgi:hypothetical protein